MRASAALPSPAAVSTATAAWVSRKRAFAERWRWWFVGAFVATQWIFVGREALFRIQHNGWIYQHGDDGQWYWTTAWTLTSLHVPLTGVGLGWPYLLSPFAAIAGPNMADGLPFIIALNILILAPLAVVGMYLVGERIAGRLFGVWSAGVFVALPVVALLLYNSRERPTVVETFLPTATGINALSDYPSMVCAIYAAYLLLRALDHDDVRLGLLCGCVLGFLVLLKPANGPLVVVGGLILAATLRHRALLGAVVGIIPALIALTLWKKTGFGYVPLFAFATVREALGSTPVVGGVHDYLTLNGGHLRENLHELREVFWSLRLLEFTLVAGTVGLVARARWKGALVAGWFLGYALVKGTATESGVYSTSLYRLMLPAWPAWTLLVAALVFCWPIGVARRRKQTTADAARAQPPRPVDRRVLLAAVLLLAVGPLVVAAAATPIPRDSVAQAYVGDGLRGSPVPVVDFHLHLQRVNDNTVALRWGDLSTSHADTIYWVYKADNIGCKHDKRGAPVCFRNMTLIGTTRRSEFVDAGANRRFFYRIALGSSAQATNSDNPDLLLLSDPVMISAPAR
jgi:hypothetical protein